MFSYTYIYFTTRTIQRYVFTVWVLKNDCVLTDTRLKNRLLWIRNKRFMEPWFGVIAGGTGFNLKHRMARTNINAKKRFDLSKLTLFGMRDRTVLLPFVIESGSVLSRHSRGQTRRLLLFDRPDTKTVIIGRDTSRFQLRHVHYQVSCLRMPLRYNTSNWITAD